MSEPRFVTQAIAEFVLRVGDDDLDGYAVDRHWRGPLDAIGYAPLAYSVAVARSGKEEHLS